MASLHPPDLIRRWMSWHREADEYTGQNALGVARSALAELIVMLEPDKPLPPEYIRLVREQDACSLSRNTHFILMT